MSERLTRAQIQSAGGKLVSSRPRGDYVEELYEMPDGALWLGSGLPDETGWHLGNYRELAFDEDPVPEWAIDDYLKFSEFEDNPDCPAVKRMGKSYVANILRAEALSRPGSTRWDLPVRYHTCAYLAQLMHELADVVGRQNVPEESLMWGGTSFGDHDIHTQCSFNIPFKGVREMDLQIDEDEIRIIITRANHDSVFTKDHGIIY